MRISLLKSKLKDYHDIIGKTVLLAWIPVNQPSDIPVELNSLVRVFNDSPVFSI